MSDRPTRGCTSKDLAFVKDPSIFKHWLPHETDLWVTATLQKNEDGFAIFQADNGATITIPEKEAASLPQVAPDQLEGLDDICSLTDVSEAALLHTVRVRYAARKIYTHVARTLIAVNPFSAMDIYSADYLAQYIPSATGGDLPPHIYGIGQDAIWGLRTSEKDQAVLISGESGAGKTESAKLIMSYVADAMRSDTQCCMDNVLRSNIILETFGNAMTVRNNNSSRFGKWLDLHFSQALQSSGATVTSFLLETTRVVRQGPEERGYHVFFQLLANSGEFPKLQLEDATKYNFIKDSKHKAPGINDAKCFEGLKEGLQAFGIGPSTQMEIWTLLTSILVLGNIEFQASGEGCEVVQMQPLERVAELLQVDTEQLKSLLLIRRIVVDIDVAEALNRCDAAMAVRDGLARLLYGQLFLWVIEQLNTTLACGQADLSGDRLLGVLDIAGFECFVHNSLEQLLINLSNEHLQQHFNHSMIKSEAEECEREGVKLPSIESFFDNEQILSLIDAKGGVMELLDETCFTNYVGTTDMTYVNKVLKTHGEHQNLIVPKAQAKPIFGIRHFAGDVQYSCEEWLQKNLEKLPTDLGKVLQSSGLGVVQEIGKAVAASTAKKAKSVTGSFRLSLRDLMAKIHAAQPHYIRCIKPNMEKLPGRFTAPAVMQQLLFGGVLAAVNIRQRGFAYRLPHHDFVCLYACITERLPSELTDEELARMEDYNKKQQRQLRQTSGRLSVPSNSSDPQLRAKQIVESLPSFLAAIGFELEPDTFALGHTKVFTKFAAGKALDAGRQRALRGMAIKIQRMWHGIVARRRFEAIKQLRVQLVAVLQRAKLGDSPENKRRRKTSDAMGGVSMKELLGSVEEMEDILCSLTPLLKEAGSLDFAHSCVDEANWLQRRLGAEISTVRETKDLSKSLAIMKIKANTAAARHRFHMPNFPELMYLERRLESLTLQVPLVTGMERVLAERASKPDDYLAKLKAALAPIDEALIQKLNGWLPELPGSKLYLEVMQAMVEEVELTDKEAAAKLSEELKLTKQAVEAHKMKAEVARVDAQKRAEEAAQKSSGNQVFDEMSAKQRSEFQQKFKQTIEKQSLATEQTISESLILEQAKEEEEQERVKAQQIADSIERRIKLKLQAQQLEVEFDLQTQLQEVAGRFAAEQDRLKTPMDKLEAELRQQFQDVYDICQEEFQQKLNAVSAEVEEEFAERMKVWKRMYICGDTPEADQVSDIIAKAHEEYDVEALDVYLGYAAESGFQDPMEHGPLSAANQFFSQVQSDTKVDEMLDNLCIEADVASPPFLVLLRFMNLSDHQTRLQGFCREHHLVGLQKAISTYAQERHLSSIFDSTVPEDIEIAYVVFGNLRNFAKLKLASTWGTQGVASFSRGKRKTRRLKTGVQQQVLFAENPSSSDAEVQAEAYRVMLSYSFKENIGEAAIMESLTIPPESESADDFNSAAALNFINIMSWMGDRPVQDCQREACHTAVLNLAAADMRYRDEIYLQSMKQLTGNPHPSSLKAGWELLHHLVASAPPSPNMSEFLRAFAINACDELSGNPETAEWGEQVATIVLDALRGTSEWQRTEAVWESAGWSTQNPKSAEVADNDI